MEKAVVAAAAAGMMVMKTLSAGSTAGLAVSAVLVATLLAHY